MWSRSPMNAVDQPQLRRETPGAGSEPPADRPRTFADSLTSAERRLRWFIVGWITLSTILNLINRNTLAILAPTFSSKFSGVSFTSAPRLEEKLRLGTDPVSQYLRSQFSSSSLQVLASSQASVEHRQAVLIDELNKVIRGSSIYEPRRFAGVALSPETQALLAQNPQSQSLHPTLDKLLRAFQIKSRDPQAEHRLRLNRALLRDAY